MLGRNKIENEEIGPLCSSLAETCQDFFQPQGFCIGWSLHLESFHPDLYLPGFWTSGLRSDVWITSANVPIPSSLALLCFHLLLSIYLSLKFSCLCLSLFVAHLPIKYEFLEGRELVCLFQLCVPGPQQRLAQVGAMQARVKGVVPAVR